MIENSKEIVQIQGNTQVLSVSFFNGCFDKNRIRSLIAWSIRNCGEKITIDLVENLKHIGFKTATQAGISLGIDDLKIPLTKTDLISDADLQIQLTQLNYKKGDLTGIEKFQQLIDTWHRTSEILKQNVIHYFRSTDVFNPVYMMAFSGARGNISQVRQLVGMRGLMSDPQGQILDFPIKSNFREGLTLTEYIISCYGARKGLVDTALKTANSGYLTRRLVDVSHHIIVSSLDCKTKRSIIVSNIIENQKIVIPLKNRLIGRVLAENIFSTKKTSTNTTKNKILEGSSSNEVTLQTLLVKQAAVAKQPKELLRYQRGLFYETKPMITSLPKGETSLHLVSPAKAGLSTYNNKKIIQNRAIACVLVFSFASNHFQKNQNHNRYKQIFEGSSSSEVTLQTLLVKQAAGFFYKANPTGNVKSEIKASLSRVVSLQLALLAKNKLNLLQPHLNLVKVSLLQITFYLNHLLVSQYELVAPKNAEISHNLAEKISTLREKVLVRSPLTCELKNSICQLCYGWSLAHSKLVSLGEAVGIIAAQSIGEPGTQLTMRTFHTGGVFSGDILKEINAPFNGIIEFTESFQGMLIRTPHGRIAFLTKIAGEFNIRETENIDFFSSSIHEVSRDSKIKKTKMVKNFQIPPFTILFVRNQEYVGKAQVIAEFSSMSTDGNQPIKVNYDLKSEMEGEVFFNIIPMTSKFRNDKLSSRGTSKLGNISILSGKIYSPLLPVNIFPQSGDLIDQNSVMGQYESIFPYDGFISIPSHKSFILNDKNKFVFTSKKLLMEKSSKMDFKYKHTYNHKNLSILDNLTTSLNYIKVNKETHPFSNTIFLNQNCISLPLHSIHYKKIGYFFLFSQYYFQSKLKYDRFFLPNSLEQEKFNLNKLKTTFYFQSFPKQYQTHSGGILTSDNFYFNKKFFYGEIFWIPQETYALCLDNIISFDSHYFSKSSTILPLQGSFLKKNTKIWVNKYNSIFFYKNSQGKISNFSSKLNGYTEITLPTSLNSIQLELRSSEISLSVASSYKLKKRWLFNKNIQTIYTKNTVNIGKFKFFNFKIVGFKKNPFSFFSYDNLLEYSSSSKVTLQSLVASISKGNEVTFWQTPRVPKGETSLEHDKTSFCPTKFSLSKVSNFPLFKTHHVCITQPQFPWLDTHFSSNTSDNFKLWSNLVIKNKQNYIYSKFKYSLSADSQKISSLAKENLLNVPFGKKKLSLQSESLLQNLIQLYKNKKIKLTVKPGWVYITNTINNVLNKNYSIIKPGTLCFQNILFDQYPVYLEFSSNFKFNFQTRRNNFKHNFTLKNILNLNSIYNEFTILKSINKDETIQIKNNLVIKKLYCLKITKSKLSKTILSLLERRSSVVSYKLLNFHINSMKFISCLYSESKFLPRCFVLIRKLKSYSFIKPSQYKQLLSYQNEKKIYFFTNSNQSAKMCNNIAYAAWFNKQNTTCLFSNLPTTDFNVLPCFQYIHSINTLNTFFPKNITILEFCVSFPIPKNSYFNRTKIQLVSKPIVNKLQLPVVKLLDKLFHMFKFNIKNQSPFKLPVEFSLKILESPELLKNFEFIVKQRKKLYFNSIKYLNFTISYETQVSNFLSCSIKNQNNKLIRTKLILSSQNLISPPTPRSFTTFFSPYDGEVINISPGTSPRCFAPQRARGGFKEFQQSSIEASHNLISSSNVNSFINSLQQNRIEYLWESSLEQTGEAEKQNWLILTNLDQVSFSTKTNDDTLQSKIVSEISVGKWIRFGTKLNATFASPESGRVTQIEKSKITLRKTQPILFSSKGLVSVSHGDLVEKNSLIIRLFFQRLQTGDIVQGIPKIEQLFEARKTSQGEILVDSIHQELDSLCSYYSQKINVDGTHKYTFDEAILKSVQQTQQNIVRKIQKVYQSQGVTIAEKHLEIIIREMTSQVEIITIQDTHFINGELMDLDLVQYLNKKIHNEINKVKYKPVILGITRKSLNSKSFISAASFQETTRILTQSAMKGSVDFLKGLKENVILGHLIPAGTGFSDRIFNSSPLSYIDPINALAKDRNAVDKLERSSSETNFQDNKTSFCPTTTSVSKDFNNLPFVSEVNYSNEATFEPKSKEIDPTTSLNVVQLENNNVNPQLKQTYVSDSGKIKKITKESYALFYDIFKPLD